MAAAGPHGAQGLLTRRAALAAGAAGAAGLLLPGRAAAATAGAADAPAGAAAVLDPRRAAAYRRLLEVLHGAPDPRFARRPAGAATRAFADWYAGQDEAVRVHAGAILDELAAGPPASCAGLVAPAPPQEAAVLAAAVALAAVTCDPAPGEDERPDAAALGVPA